MCRHYLFFRAASSQVSSARMSLTTVFGMGTGGPSSQSTPTHETFYLVNARDSIALPFTNCKYFFHIFLTFHKLNKKIFYSYTVKCILDNCRAEPRLCSALILINCLCYIKNNIFINLIWVNNHIHRCGVVYESKI